MWAASGMSTKGLIERKIHSSRSRFFNIVSWAKYQVHRVTRHNMAFESFRVKSNPYTLTSFTPKDPIFTRFTLRVRLTIPMIFAFFFFFLLATILIIYIFFQIFLILYFKILSITICVDCLHVTCGRFWKVRKNRMCIEWPWPRLNIREHHNFKIVLLSPSPLHSRLTLQIIQVLGLQMYEISKNKSPKHLKLNISKLQKQ